MSTSECYPDKAPKIDALLETLAHHIRREIIHYFENISRSSRVAIDNLVSHIENRVPEVTHEEVKVSLHHNHLPKLRSYGWLDYDTRSHQIRYYGQESAGPLMDEVAAMFRE